MKYIYITKRDNKNISGVIEARHSFEALHNARIEAFNRSATGKIILLTQI